MAARSVSVLEEYGISSDSGVPVTMELIDSSSKNAYSHVRHQGILKPSDAPFRAIQFEGSARAPGAASASARRLGAAMIKVRQGFQGQVLPSLQQSWKLTGLLHGILFSSIFLCPLPCLFQRVYCTILVALCFCSKRPFSTGQLEACWVALLGPNRMDFQVEPVDGMWFACVR